MQKYFRGRFGVRCHFQVRSYSSPFRPNLNFDYLLDEQAKEEIQKNLRSRKGIGDIEAIHSTWKKLEPFLNRKEMKESISEGEYQRLWDQLYEEALLIPNTTHPSTPLGDENASEIVDQWTGADQKATTSQILERIGQSWRALLFPSESCGQRSYCLIDSLARLEKAILGYAYEEVVKNNFTPAIVSDFVPTQITSACGVQQRLNSHAIQYLLSNEKNIALSGTAEMGIAAMLAGRRFKLRDLPISFVSKSRCFRPEISKSASEAKLYRVHEFTKVEMFVVCAPDQSDTQLKRIIQIQKEIFQGLDVTARLKHMSTEELGASAHRKYDIEAWMPGRKLWGEVSSASNCTDYQARRLDMQYIGESGNPSPVHTCNGTAIASTRAMIAILETHQTKKGGLTLPKMLNSRIKKASSNRLKFQKAPPLAA